MIKTKHDIRILPNEFYAESHPIIVKKQNVCLIT